MSQENIVKTEEDYLALKEAANISSKILKEIRDTLAIGKSAKELDDLAVELCKKYGVKPAFKNQPGPLQPYPANICISTNEEILHTIPTANRVFTDGDVVKLDFGIIHKGFYTDHCVTVGLGNVSEEERRLIETSKLCIDKAVEKAIVGNKIGDISSTMQAITEMAGFNFVVTYCGHGIGKQLHLAPEVPAYGVAGTGVELKDGMVLCIENQVTIGSSDLRMQRDGWTLKTTDGSKGSMFEHMVIVRKGKPEILTILD